MIPAEIPLKHTCSLRCVTCASSSFSPLAGADVTGIFLADEGLDDGVEDLGVVELALEAPVAEKLITMNAYAMAIIL